jgi:transposase InsO family protein
MRALLSVGEVGELIERSPRTVRRADFVTQPASEQSGNGKVANLYELASLSPDAQRGWAARQSKVVELLSVKPAAGQLALALTSPVGPNLSDEDKAEAQRRYQVIEALIEPDKYYLLWVECRRSKVALVKRLAELHSTRPRTIYHWVKAWKSNGLPGLVAKDRADKGKPKALNTAALDFLLAAALPHKGSYGQLSVKEIFRAYGEERTWRASHAHTILGDFELRKYARYLDSTGRLSSAAQLPAASYETFRSWFHKIPDVLKVMARDGEEAFHNTQEILSFRAISDIRPLDYVVMDHRRLDIFCLAPDRGGWRLVRPWLTAAIDMRTRKWLSWAIVENPSSDSIASVLKRAFLDWGLPGAVYWDNGKDFTCEWLEGGRPKTRKVGGVKELEPAIRGVMGSLGIRVHHAIVRRARSKIIEPNFTNVANFDRTLPWWCGHRPSSRPERFADLTAKHEAWLGGAPEPAFPTISEVAGIYDEFLASLNEREHSGEGMRKITVTGRGWMAPNECWEREISKVERKRVPDEVLQFCFAKRRDLTVRSGEVKATFGGKLFHYRLADASLRLMSLNGCEVQLAYDPFDLGTAALYYENRFVGLVNCVELRRMGEQAFVQDEKDRRTARREVKKFITAVHQAVPVADHAERAARRREVAVKRIEPARAEVEVAVGGGVAEAAESARTERSFSFALAGSDTSIARANAEAYRDDDPEDGSFEFFSGGQA